MVRTEVPTELTKYQPILMGWYLLIIPVPTERRYSYIVDEWWLFYFWLKMVMNAEFSCRKIKHLTCVLNLQVTKMHSHSDIDLIPCSMICIFSLISWAEPGFCTNVIFPDVLNSNPHKVGGKQDVSKLLLIHVLFHVDCRSIQHIQDGDSDSTIVTSSGHVTTPGISNTRWQYHTY